MEKSKQVGNSSSSFTMDLFGPKDSLKSSSTSAALFDSIFGPPAKVHGRDTPHSDFGSAFGNAHKDIPQKSNGVVKKDKNSTYENGTVEPCYYNSIYYGGQEVYSPPTQNISSQHVVKKDGASADQNEGNSNCASRGNWWQGSLYY